MTRTRSFSWGEACNCTLHIIFPGVLLISRSSKEKCIARAAVIHLERTMPHQENYVLSQKRIRCRYLRRECQTGWTPSYLQSEDRQRNVTFFSVCMNLTTKMKLTECSRQRIPCFVMQITFTNNRFVKLVPAGVVVTQPMSCPFPTGGVGGSGHHNAPVTRHIQQGTAQRKTPRVCLK